MHSSIRVKQTACTVGYQHIHNNAGSDPAAARLFTRWQAAACVVLLVLLQRRCPWICTAATKEQGAAGTVHADNYRPSACSSAPDCLPGAREVRFE